MSPERVADWYAGKEYENTKEWIAELRAEIAELRAELKRLKGAA